MKTIRYDRVKLASILWLGSGCGPLTDLMTVVAVVKADTKR